MTAEAIIAAGIINYPYWLLLSEIKRSADWKIPSTRKVKVKKEKKRNLDNRIGSTTLTIEDKYGCRQQHPAPLMSHSPRPVLRCCPVSSSLPQSVCLSHHVLPCCHFLPTGTVRESNRKPKQFVHIIAKTNDMTARAGEKWGSVSEERC